MFGAGGRVTQPPRTASGLGRREFGESGFGRAWLRSPRPSRFACSTTGFLHVYNPALTAMRARRGWFPMPTFEFRQWLTAPSVAVSILLRPHPGRYPRPTMAAGPGLVLCRSHVLEWHGTHRVYDSRTPGPLGDILAPGAGILLVAVAIGGLMMRLRQTASGLRRARPCLGTKRPPRTIRNAGPDVASHPLL